MKSRLLAGLAPLALLGAAPGTVADAIYVNANVLTVDAQSRHTSAFAVKGDRFLAVGDEAAVRRLAGRGTRVIDLHGATVVPGFSDSHDHLWNSAKYLHRGVDMIGVASFDEMRRRLVAAVAGAKPGAVVFTTSGWSFRPAPTRAQLDAISARVPIVVVGFRRGNGVFNSAALARLGISKANPHFMGETVPVDASGEPIGTAPHYPHSVLMMDALLPPLSRSDEDAMVRAEMARRNALGITSIRELALWPDGLRGLQRMQREGRLTLRIAVGVEFVDQARTAAQLAALPRPSRTDPWLWLDSIGEEPWPPVTIPVDCFTQMLRVVARLGWRPAPHVSSDGATGSGYDVATEAVLQAYETIDRERPIRDRRWYVEHVPAATPEQIARMARLGLVVSAGDFGYRAPPSLPPERLAHFNPIRRFLDAGLLVIGGSDTQGPNPIEMEPDNPMLLFHFYVTRRAKNGELIAPEERISREAALRILTVNAARAAFQERQRGPIAPAMLADFVVLNQDPMTVPEDRILTIRPLATFVGSRQVFAVAGAGLQDVGR